MSTPNKRNKSNNQNRIAWNPRQNPPSTIKRRMHYKQHELRKEYPTNNIHLQHLETVPPPNNKQSIYNTYTYRYGSILYPELQYNMLHTYPNPNYVPPPNTANSNVMTPVKKKKTATVNANKSQKAYNSYMKYFTGKGLKTKKHNKN